MLRIVNSTQFFLYAFPVFVGETYEELIVTFPELAQNSLFARPVSVLVQSSTSYEPLSVTSDRVGVLVDSNAAIYSDPVGIFFGDGQSGHPELRAQSPRVLPQSLDRIDPHKRNS